MAFYPAIFTVIQPAIGNMAVAPFLVSQLLHEIRTRFPQKFIWLGILLDDTLNLGCFKWFLQIFLLFLIMWMGSLLIVSVRQPADMGMCDY